MKIENAKFKHPVVPGDTLVFRLELLSPIRRGFVICKHTHTAEKVDNRSRNDGANCKKNQVKI